MDGFLCLFTWLQEAIEPIESVFSSALLAIVKRNKKNYECGILIVFFPLKFNNNLPYQHAEQQSQGICRQFP